MTYSKIAAQAEQALRSVFGDCYYSQTPDFSFTPEPDLYAIYSMTERPSVWGDGDIQGYEYTLTINVYSAAREPAVYAALTAALKPYGFEYCSGGSVYEDRFPPVCQWYMDYKICAEAVVNE